MDKMISLADLAQELLYKAQTMDFCRVESIGVSRVEGVYYHAFYVKFGNGREDVIRIPVRTE